MTKSISRLAVALLVGGAMLAAPAASFANKGECGQPTSTGATPKSSDALTILKFSVGQEGTDCTAEPCICDVNGSGTTTSSDSLLTLKKAVGQDVTLNCSKCGPKGPPCTSAVIQSRTGSDLDSGWTGIAHNSDLILGASITVHTLRRCSDNQAPCTKDSDCGNNDCVATCDCNGDTSCEITGPAGQKQCLTTLKNCTPNRCLLGSITQATACTTNADCTGGATCTGTDASQCAAGVACVSMFGPPLPLSSGGTPVCVISVFDGPLTGTADSATGEAVAAASLKSRVFLGIKLDQPCPRCGAPSPSLKVGDTSTCVGGQFNGAACTVDGVSPTFGGTSFDCPPDLAGNVSGSGLAIKFSQVSTGTVSKTAKLPCTNPSFRSNPLNAPTNPGKCLDNNAACSSNADCKRCTGDSTIVCATNGDCGASGSCAEAPDQPVTCGFWCSCGFCNNNASSPCFDDTDCPQGQTCQVGTGASTAQNAPQQKPNDCSSVSDKNICGLFETEKCANTTKGECSEQPYRSCTEGTTICEDNNAGTCVIEPRPCFGPRITRTGTPSPLGTYCAYENKTCTTNADCTGANDYCAPDSSRAGTVALFCVPSTSSSSVNNVGGITGPGAVTLNNFLQVCRCGDGKIGCDEQCDDGNTANGDGCSDLCQNE